MKTYVAHVSFADGENPETVESVLTSDIGEVAYSLGESGAWLLTCPGAFANLNNDAQQPECTSDGYATQAFTRLSEEVRPALIALGFEVPELAPVPSA